MGAGLIWGRILTAVLCDPAGAPSHIEATNPSRQSMMSRLGSGRAGSRSGKTGLQKQRGAGRAMSRWADRGGQKKARQEKQKDKQQHEHEHEHEH